jgi:hypothetical protein
MKNSALLVVTPCGSCKNRHFGGNHRLHHWGGKNQRAWNNLSNNYQLKHTAKKYIICLLVLTLFLARWFLPTWWWKLYISPKRRFLQDPYFFIVAAVETRKSYTEVKRSVYGCILTGNTHIACGRVFIVAAVTLAPAAHTRGIRDSSRAVSRVQTSVIQRCGQNARYSGFWEQCFPGDRDLSLSQTDRSVSRYLEVDKRQTHR